MLFLVYSYISFYSTWIKIIKRINKELRHSSSLIRVASELLEHDPGLRTKFENTEKARYFFLSFIIIKNTMHQLSVVKDHLEISAFTSRHRHRHSNINIVCYTTEFAFRVNSWLYTCFFQRFFQLSLNVA